MCKDYNFKDVVIPPKQISITNNSDRVIYPVLTTSPHPVDQWLQACARDTTNNYAVTHVEKLYVNEGQGIPPNSSVTITLPLFSTRTPTQSDPDTYITWWNGGRAVLADENNNLVVPRIDTKSTVPADVSCSAQGTTCALSEYTSEVQFLPDVYAQLSEYTFGNVNPPPGQSQPLLVPENVGYNISYVDHVYMPVAIGPKGNPYIGYNGSAMPLQQFKTTLQTFLDSPLGTGWPVYNLFPNGAAGDVRLPGGYNIFAERAGVLDPSANVPVKPVRGDGITVPPVLTVQQCIAGGCTNQQQLDLHFGDAVQRIQNLWGSCVTGWDWGPGNTQGTYVTQPLAPNECATAIGATASISQQLTQIRDFFQANFDNYNALWAAGKCSDPDPKNPVRVPAFTFMQAITHIYGWVPFNEGCGADANKLADTVGPNGMTHAQIQPIYIHDLQYNYQQPYAKADLNLVFNPYVQLIHDPAALNMNAYAFSVDDGVGFMTELGSGLNFTVGGTNGLDNKQQFSYQNGFTLKLGEPSEIPYGQSMITKYGVCVVGADAADPNCTQDKEDVTMPTIRIPGFRVGTVASYPIVVRFTDLKGNRYIVPVTQPFQTCKLDSTGVCHPANAAALVDQANCKVLTPSNTVHADSTRWCTGVDPNETAPVNQPQLIQNYLSFPVPVDYLPKAPQ